MQQRGLTAIVAVLFACGGADSVTTPPDQSDHHQDLVIETIPYAALGQSRIVFLRRTFDETAPHGLVTLDGATHTATRDFAHTVYGVAVSPDRSRVAYNLVPADGTSGYEIALSPVATLDGAQLGGPGNRHGPSWSPDGSKIVYTETDKSSSLGNRVVLQSAAAGANDRQVIWEGDPSCASASSPHVNSAGDVIFMYNDCSTSGVGLKKPGLPFQRIYQPVGGVQSLSWSPSGIEIADIEDAPFQTFGARRVYINVMNADGSNVRNLLTLPQDRTIGPRDLSLRWSADGSTLFYSLGDSPSESHIYALPSAGGAPAQITSLAGAQDQQLSCVH